MPPDPPIHEDGDELLESPDDSPEESSDSDVAHFRWKVTKNLTRRIDQYLVDRVGYLSRAGVQRVIDEGLVKVNGRVVKSSYHPRNGDDVVMVAPPKPISELVPEPIPLEIIYEDDDFLALNKQTNLIVHPARGRWSGTLVNGLVHYGKKWSTVNGNWRPGILHRLDRNTTGIMLVAKSDEAHWRLARQFENRTIQKTYMAICHGVPELLSDVINMPIGQDKYIREKQAPRKEENGGKSAVTLYEVQETLPPAAEKTGARNSALGIRRSGNAKSPSSPSAESRIPSAEPHILLPSKFAHDRKSPAPPEKFSLIKLSPKTGRTHQLRVHLSQIGHPMVGDTLYGGRIFQSGDFIFERQALHAYEITFIHPTKLTPMTLNAPLPTDFETLLGILRGKP
jgi:23S rRNA pseudouridine1911/1915/1917 synthase